VKVFSNSTLREGVFFEMHGDMFQTESRERSAHTLANRYVIDPALAARVWDSVDSLNMIAPACWLSK
ncbi:exopolyphosphatase, partial [Alteromonas sp. LMIT007]|nr:exopolyphosphatase [Opacimonas viscosa]